jgi:hypothetical protein
MLDLAIEHGAHDDWPRLCYSFVTLGDWLRSLRVSELAPVEDAHLRVYSSRFLGIALRETSMVEWG